MSYLRNQSNIYDDGSAINSFDGAYSFLSNFYDCEIRERLSDGTRIVYPSVEHAYQASKTLDPEIRRRVADEPTPGKAKRAGGRNGYVIMYPEFEAEKVDIMRDLLLKKFSNPHFKELLLSTGNLILIEGNTWGDQFWGYDMRAKRGYNVLGQLLMEIREAFRNLDTASPIHLTGLYSTLSPSYPCTFKETQLDGSIIVYPSLSHTFNAMNCASSGMKRRIAEGLVEGSDILISPSSSSSKLQLPYNRINVSLWEAEKKVMKSLCELKFTQERFRNILMLTSDKEILYSNSSDTFWGLVDGEGENIFGKILTQVREEIRHGKLG